MQTKITAVLIMAGERRQPLLKALESCGSLGIRQPESRRQVGFLFRRPHFRRSRACSHADGTRDTLQYPRPWRYESSPLSWRGLNRRSFSSRRTPRLGASSNGSSSLSTRGAADRVSGMVLSRRP
jgi:hypothetical protein